MSNNGYETEKGIDEYKHVRHDAGVPRMKHIPGCNWYPGECGCGAEHINAHIDSQAEQLKGKDAQIATIAILIKNKGVDREHHPIPTWERQVYEMLKEACGARDYSELLNLRQGLKGSD